MNHALEVRLREATAQLAERMIAETYEDPFWIERFGERGRRYAVEDAAHHLSYLCHALSANDGSVFTRYARWLQALLVSRGMCSKHLADSFDKLGRDIAASIPDASAALDVLAQGRRALVYQTGPAAELNASASDLLRALPSAADERDIPSESARTPYLLSYLTDALHARAHANFERHVLWLSEFLPRRGGSTTRLIRQLTALRAGLLAPSKSAPSLAGDAAGIVESALLALASATERASE